MKYVENNFQRPGATSNTQVGTDFEKAAQKFFAGRGVPLQLGFPELVGYKIKKKHTFDLGSRKPPILVECKSYTWTSGGNSPSAKLRGLNEVMLLFTLAPPRYRKILCMLKHMRREKSLAAHYIDTQGYLIGPNVEIWELDPETERGEQVFPNSN